MSSLWEHHVLLFGNTMSSFKKKEIAALTYIHPKTAYSPHIKMHEYLKKRQTNNYLNIWFLMICKRFDE